MEQVKEPLHHRSWGIVIGLTIFFHFVLFLLPWGALFPSKPFVLPTPVEIKELSQKDLDRIRSQWEKRLVNIPKNFQETETPKDARYVSEKNRVVENETQALKSDVIAAPGQASVTRQKSLSPSLSDLGIKTAQIALSPGKKRIDQTLDDPTLSFGAENLLNTERTTYYSYYTRIQEGIGPIWKSRVGELSEKKRYPSGKYQTDIEVISDPKGKVKTILFHQRSGIPEFDESAIYAWKHLREFPNPPAGLIENGEVRTRWTFTVNLTEGAQVRFVQP